MRNIKGCKRGPYKGRTEYTICTKLHMGLPLTDEERQAHRAKRAPVNRRCKAAQVATVEGRSHRLWYDAKTRAEKEGVPFTLTEDWIQERLRSGKCEMTGINFELGPSESNRVHKYVPSLDRIDAGKGYVIENVRVVVWFFNHARGEYTDQDLLDFACILVKRAA